MMPRGREVGLGSGNIVLDGAQLSPSKKGTDLNFQPMSIVAKWSPISAAAELLLATCCDVFLHPLFVFC